MSLRILTILYLVSFGKCELSSWFSKGKAFLSEKLGGNREKMFLVEDITLYPGINKEYREYHRKNWNKYYDCLNTQQQSVASHKSFSPEARMVFEGNSIRLDCKICLSPDEQSKLDLLAWYMSPLDNDTMTELDLTEHIIINPEDKSLQMYNVQMGQSGRYGCRMGQSIAPIYYLTVVNDSEPLLDVKPETAPHARHAAQDIVIKKLGLNIKTTWGQWSACNKCGKVGKKVRVGFCTIKYEGIDQEKELENHDIAMKNAIKIVKYFGPSGIPCRSHITPHVLYTNKIISQRPSEIMTAFCREKCPGVKVFQVRDEFGNVIETANNSAGFYSMLQGLPDINPTVDRTTIYKELGAPLLLSCPGNLNSDIPVLWQVGTKSVVPNLLARNSDGRVYVTNKDSIRFTTLQISDANIYSCWQRNELAGTIRLVVTKRTKLSIDQHVQLLGIFLIFATFCFVLVKTYANRKYIVY